MSTVITTTPLAGRVAVVTGASSGIGEVTAVRLAALGAKVAVAARRADNLDALAARIADTRRHRVRPWPSTSPTAPPSQAAADQVADRFGKADLVFNNAGVQLISGIEELKSTTGSGRSTSTSAA